MGVRVRYAYEQLYEQDVQYGNLSVMLARCGWPDCGVGLTERQATWKQFRVSAVNWQTELEVSEQSDDALAAAMRRRRRAQFLTFNHSLIIDVGVETRDD